MNANPVRTAAETAFALNMHPIPIKPCSKQPAGGNGWPRREYTLDDFPADGNIGLHRWHQASSSTAGTPPLTRTPAELVPLIRQKLAAGAAHYRAAGELLLQAKAALKHGEWLPWLKRHFALTPREAQRYLALAKTTGVSYPWRL